MSESGALSFFSLPVDLFLIYWFLGSMPIAKPTKIGRPTSVKRTSSLSRHACRVLWSRRICWIGSFGIAILPTEPAQEGEHTYPTMLAGLLMGTGAEAFLLSTWAILAMRQRERRVEWFVVWRCMGFIGPPSGI